MKTTKMPGSVKLRYAAGQNADGKQIFKTRILSNINPDASDDSVYALKALLAAVQENPALDLVRTENKSMTEE